MNKIKSIKKFDYAYKLLLEYYDDIFKPMPEDMKNYFMNFDAFEDYEYYLINYTLDCPSYAARVIVAYNGLVCGDPVTPEKFFHEIRSNYEEETKEAQE